MTKCQNSTALISTSKCLSWRKQSIPKHSPRAFSFPLTSPSMCKGLKKIVTVQDMNTEHHVHSSCRKLHLDFVQVLNWLHACCNITPLWDDLFAELNWNLKQYRWCSSAPRFVFKAPKLKTAANLSSTAIITAREVSETLFNASGFNLKGDAFRVNALMDSEAETGQLRWKAATW